MSPAAPLAGRRVLVTRRAEQSADLVARLEALGAVPVVVPAIDVALPEDPGPLDAALRRLSAYDWLALTSANAVECVARRLRELCLRLGSRPALASVGPGTSQVIRVDLGRAPDLEPASDYQATALAALLAERGGEGTRLLFPTSDRGRDTLPATLSERGWVVDTVVAYRTIEAPGLPEGLAAAGRLDLATFASPSAVAASVAARPGLAALPCAVIGPVTARAAQRAGFGSVRVAEPSTVAGLVAAIEAHFAAAP